MELRSIIESNRFEHTRVLANCFNNYCINLFNCSSGYLFNDHKTASPLHERYDKVMAISSNDGITFPMAKNLSRFNLVWPFLD
jgi:hypothetical protein